MSCIPEPISMKNGGRSRDFKIRNKYLLTVEKEYYFVECFFLFCLCLVLQSQDFDFFFTGSLMIEMKAG